VRLNRKVRQHKLLGMPHGTAAGRLRKLLLFKFVSIANENNCFKCNKEITNADELSIEHKQPWENISSELFWDLENITFSHLSCNRPHRYGSGDNKKIGQDGTSWCSKHQRFLPVVDFYVDKRNWDGLSSNCKKCHCEYTKARKAIVRNKN
jgi:hypothetical protein